MRFKAIKGTPAYENMMKYRDKRKEVTEVQYEFVESLGGNGSFYSSAFYTHGGITAVCFDEDPGKGWLLEKTLGGNAYKPDLRTKVGQQIQAKIEKLPVISRYEISKYAGLAMLSKFNQIGVDICLNEEVDYVLISLIETWEVTPTIEGWEEITVTEYKQLQEQLYKKIEEAATA